MRILGFILALPVGIITWFTVASIPVMLGDHYLWAAIFVLIVGPASGFFAGSRVVAHFQSLADEADANAQPTSIMPSLSNFQAYTQDYNSTTLQREQVWATQFSGQSISWMGQVRDVSCTEEIFTIALRFELGESEYVSLWLTFPSEDGSWISSLTMHQTVIVHGTIDPTQGHEFRSYKNAHYLKITDYRVEVPEMNEVTNKGCLLLFIAPVLGYSLLQFCLD